MRAEPEAEITGPLRRIDAWVFAAEDPRRLAALRIGLFGLLAVRVARTDYRFVADQPAELFDPVSLFHLLSEMPSGELVAVVQPLTVLAALAAAAGLLPRLSFPLAWTGAIFLGLMLNATGKIVHNDVLLLLCLIPLLAAPGTAGDRWALRLGPRADHRPEDHGGSSVAALGPARAPSVAHGWPVRAAMLVVGLAYLFVGLQKLRYSGIGWVADENLRWVLYAASDAAAGGPNQLALFVADRPPLAHLMAAGTIAVEVGFILCLPFARLRWVLVPAVVGLHLGIWTGMGLDYSGQALTAIVVFVNWPALLELLRGRGSPAAPEPRREALR
jgi:hypothetical protein